MRDDVIALKQELRKYLKRIVKKLDLETWKDNLEGKFPVGDITVKILSEKKDWFSSLTFLHEEKSIDNIHDSLYDCILPHCCHIKKPLKKHEISEILELFLKKINRDVENFHWFHDIYTGLGFEKRLKYNVYLKHFNDFSIRAELFNNDRYDDFHPYYVHFTLERNNDPSSVHPSGNMTLRSTEEHFFKFLFLALENRYLNFEQLPETWRDKLVCLE